MLQHVVVHRGIYMHETQDTLLRVADVITAMGISRSTWQKLVSTGQTPPIVRIGQVQRIRRDAFTAWLAKQEDRTDTNSPAKQS